ncbi:MAG: efflux RND transporter periplasmic adaptor subunit [Ignavibacteriales bacterium]|nr:efflux RND transporter periplasmic adaptor subunit [Ignavibacteriales bacterium]
MKAIRQYYILIVCLIVALIASCGRQPESRQTQAVANQSPQPTEYYTCPMHPSVRSDKPGACPICHMTLVKVNSNHASSDSSELSGAITMSAMERVLANISTAMVESKALIKEISAVGKIDLAESSTQQITARFGGRIERLFVSFVGQKVKMGEPVAEIYSPDAVAAQREFVVAMNSPANTSGESALLQQTRLKLKLLGFTDRQLNQLTKDQTPVTVVTIYSPIAGTVLKKNIHPQQYVATGESLLDVSDLRSVWLQLDIYESDIASLHIGQAVEASLDATPSLAVRGTISFISPTLDPATRTARVRAILDNPSGNLRPEMFAHARILVPLLNSLVVPTTAVVSNGKADVVWVEREPGHFEPRKVRLGERASDFYQILEGLQKGENVATRGAYLIDSESQLRLSNTGGTGK